MNLLAKTFAAVTCMAAVGFSSPVSKPVTPQKIKPASKIQVAILLDVSGSMDGLIEQAKAQLWNMVTTLGKAECVDNSKPRVELALYEYGRTTNDKNKGYVKQLSPFTNDLDEVSKILFGLKTDGGDEYCGQVIYTSMDELTWDAAPENYKVIFIAGNEDFLQGSLPYTKACTKAKEKGVIVNTIYCGDYQSGIAEHWKLAGECGSGSYTNIDQNIVEQEIPTPYDTTLMVLNSKLNGTYINYGASGYVNLSRQKEVDALNFNVNSTVAAKRIEAKAQSNVYGNASWDLVDAANSDSTYIAKVDRKTLPDSLRSKTTEQLRQYVQAKNEERALIQKQINEAAANRNKYITDEKAKAANNTNQQTLETEVEKTIKEQVKRFNMRIN
jgi:hypothetical protein